MAGPHPASVAGLSQADGPPAGANGTRPTPRSQRPGSWGTLCSLCNKFLQRATLPAPRAPCSALPPAGRSHQTTGLRPPHGPSGSIWAGRVPAPGRRAARVLASLPLPAFLKIITINMDLCFYAQKERSHVGAQPLGLHGPRAGAAWPLSASEQLTLGQVVSWEPLQRRLTEACSLGTHPSRCQLTSTTPCPARPA